MKLRTLLTACFVSIFLLGNASVFAKSDPLSDSYITAKVKSKLALNKAISLLNLNVSTNNKVVIIAGNVDSDSQASTVIELAQETEGVKDVDVTQLKVKESQHPFADTTITAKVKGLYLKEKVFGNQDIASLTVNVETNDGVVYLTGVADNQTQINNATAIAKSVSGVKEVQSTIEIKAS